MAHAHRPYGDYRPVSSGIVVAAVLLLAACASDAGPDDPAGPDDSFSADTRLSADATAPDADARINGPPCQTATPLALDERIVLAQGMTAPPARLTGTVTEAGPTCCGPGVYDWEVTIAGADGNTVTLVVGLPGASSEPPALVGEEVTLEVADNSPLPEVPDISITLWSDGELRYFSYRGPDPTTHGCHEAGCPEIVMKPLNCVPASTMCGDWTTGVAMLSLAGESAPLAPGESAEVAGLTWWLGTAHYLANIDCLHVQSSNIHVVGMRAMAEEQ